MLTNQEKLYSSGRTFTPSAPINKRDLFSGRINQIKLSINAIAQPGQHVIIFGERGVGKTSLANVIQEFLPTEEIISIKINGDEAMSFKLLFQTILKEIKLQYSTPGMGFNAEETKRIRGLDTYIEKEDISPNELRLLLGQLGKTIIIIDEFDRITQPRTKRLLADTIKNFSDYNVDTTFILVGVSDSVESLVLEHQSVERALVQVRMPRMSDGELGAIIDKGLKILEMTIEPEAREKIIKLSQGLPHYTHLLSLYSSQSAIENERNFVNLEDVNNSIKEAVDKVQQTIKEKYYMAINSARGNMYRQVLLACSLAENDEMGFFTAKGVSNTLSKIMDKKYNIAGFARHLNQFCHISRGPILEQKGISRRFRYRFCNPLMETYVIMEGISKGTILDI